MHVFEVDEKKAAWLALRADAHVVLNSHFDGSQKDTTNTEQLLYTMVTQNDTITDYHMQIYKELLCLIISCNKSINLNFDQDMLSFFQSLNQQHKMESMFESKEYETPSQKLFYTKVRPQLMALAANTQMNLPACPKCNTKEFMSIIGIQTRSGDEAETLFPQCTKCKTLLKDHALN